MGHQTMEHHGHGNVFGTILTVVFLFISKFTVSDLAAWAAVLAGFTTAGYNIWRFIRERNNKKNKKE